MRGAAGTRRPAFGRAVALLAAGVLLFVQTVPGAAGQSPEGSAVNALLLEVARNERAMTARRFEYTWMLKVTDRAWGKGGEPKRQAVSVYEVYPVRGEFARKLVSKDGVPVSEGRAEKELKQTAKRLEDAARAEQKRAEAGPTPTPAPASAEAQNPNGIPSFGFSTGQKHGGSGEISFAAWRFFR